MHGVLITVTQLRKQETNFFSRYFDMYHSEHKIYLGAIDPDVNPVTQILQDYFSFLILFNYLIPISLYVTIEMHKFIGSFFMEWDIELYDAETNQPCIVNTSDLNEELGQVSNVLLCYVMDSEAHRTSE